MREKKRWKGKSNECGDRQENGMSHFFSRESKILRNLLVNNRKKGNLVDVFCWCFVTFSFLLIVEIYIYRFEWRRWFVCSFGDLLLILPYLL